MSQFEYRWRFSLTWPNVSSGTEEPGSILAIDDLGACRPTRALRVTYRIAAAEAWA